MLLHSRTLACRRPRLPLVWLRLWLRPWLRPWLRWLRLVWCPVRPLPAQVRVALRPHRHRLPAPARPWRPSAARRRHPCPTAPAEASALAMATSISAWACSAGANRLAGSPPVKVMVTTVLVLAAAAEAGALPRVRRQPPRRTRCRPFDHVTPANAGGRPPRRVSPACWSSRHTAMPRCLRVAPDSSLPCHTDVPAVAVLRGDGGAIVLF